MVRTKVESDANTYYVTVLSPGTALHVLLSVSKGVRDRG